MHMSQTVPPVLQLANRNKLVLSSKQIMIKYHSKGLKHTISAICICYAVSGFIFSVEQKSDTDTGINNHTWINPV